MYAPPRRQQQLVNDACALGLGAGGFYRPSYGGRGTQQLFMMNLGWHWNLQARSCAHAIVYLCDSSHFAITVQ